MLFKLKFLLKEKFSSQLKIKTRLNLGLGQRKWENGQKILFKNSDCCLNENFSEKWKFSS